MFGKRKREQQALVAQPELDGYLPAQTQTGHPDPAPQMQATPAPSPVDAANSFIMTDAPTAPDPVPTQAIPVASQPRPIQDFVSTLQSFTPPPVPAVDHSDDDHQHEVPAPAAYTQEESVGESIFVTHTPPPAPLPEPEPTPEPFIAEPVPEPMPEPEPIVEEPAPQIAPEPTPAVIASNDLLSLKQQALQQLSPLVGLLDQIPEEKFRTTMMMLQSTDDQGLVPAAYQAAQAIVDDKARAQALLDVVNEINYFSQKNAQ
jgi:hypothetical protein